jgi:hypothetical protein
MFFRQFFHVGICSVFLVCCAGREIPAQGVEQALQVPPSLSGSPDSQRVQEKLLRVLTAAEIPPRHGPPD